MGACISFGRNGDIELGCTVWAISEKVANLINVVAFNVVEQHMVAICLPLRFENLVDVLAEQRPRIVEAENDGEGLFHVWQHKLRWDCNTCSQASIRPLGARAVCRLEKAPVKGGGGRGRGRGKRRQHQDAAADSLIDSDVREADLARGCDFDIEGVLEEIVEEDIQELIEGGAIDNPENPQGEEEEEEEEEKGENCGNESDPPLPPPRIPPCEDASRVASLLKGMSLLSRWLPDAQRALAILQDRSEALRRKAPGDHLTLICLDNKVCFVKWVEGTTWGREVKLEKRKSGDSAGAYFGIWPTTSMIPRVDYKDSVVVHPDAGTGIQRVRALRPQIKTNLVLLKQMWETAILNRTDAVACLESCWICEGDAPRDGQAVSRCSLCLRYAHPACCHSLVITVPAARTDVEDARSLLPPIFRLPIVREEFALESDVDADAAPAKKQRQEQTRSSQLHLLS